MGVRVRCLRALLRDNPSLTSTRLRPFHGRSHTALPLRSYNDRGLIPRALSHIFEEFEARDDTKFAAYISYLEIYNEVGYDLLDPSHETKELEELPKVHLMTDEDGNVSERRLVVAVSRA